MGTQLTGTEWQTLEHAGLFSWRLSEGPGAGVGVGEMQDACGQDAGPILNLEVRCFQALPSLPVREGDWCRQPLNKRLGAVSGGCTQAVEVWLPGAAGWPPRRLPWRGTMLWLLCPRLRPPALPARKHHVPGHTAPVKLLPNLILGSGS